MAQPMFNRYSMIFTCNYDETTVTMAYGVINDRVVNTQLNVLADDGNPIPETSLTDDDETGSDIMACWKPLTLIE